MAASANICLVGGSKVARIKNSCVEHRQITEELSCLFLDFFLLFFFLLWLALVGFTV